MKITEQELIKNLIKGMPTILMNRINFGGWRLYTQREPFQVYSGLTGALAASTFKGDIESKRLGKWRDAMIDQLGGQKTQEAYLESMADFGTLCHEAIVRIWDKKKLDWEYEQDYAYKFFENSDKVNGIIPSDGVIRKRVFEYCKTAASLMQFIFDEVEEIYAVEGMAKCDALQIATPIDVTCRLKRKGNPIVTLNIKTSEQFTDSHRTQVAVEKYLWNETYTDCQATGTGLLRAKAWSLKKGVPTYEFELVDDKVLLENALNRLNLCKSDPAATYLSFPKDTIVFTGETKLGEQPKMITKTLEQLMEETSII